MALRLGVRVSLDDEVPGEALRLGVRVSLGAEGEALRLGVRVSLGGGDGPGDDDDVGGLGVDDGGGPEGVAADADFDGGDREDVGDAGRLGVRV